MQLGVFSCMLTSQLADQKSLHKEVLVFLNLATTTCVQVLSYGEVAKQWLQATASGS